MAKISPLMIAPPLIFAGLAALFILGMQRENPNALPSALKGQKTPELTVVALGDLPIVTDEILLSGDVKVVNFWASWCGPCRAEHPQLEDLAQKGVKIYGINYKDAPADALGFLEELGNPYAAIGADPNARNGIEWGLYGVPETFVVDGNGRIAFRFPGPITKDVLENTILPEIEKAR